MDDVTRGKIRARHYAGGVALDIGGLAYGCPAGGPPFIVIERGDLDDAIAALQAMRETKAGPCAVAAGFAMHGRWRVYFNKHGRADLPWCIAPDGGGWELAVPSVLITTDATTAYQPKATPDDEDGRPSAWIAVEGVLTVAGGRASIAASAAPEVQTP